MQGVDEFREINAIHNERSITPATDTMYDDMDLDDDSNYDDDDEIEELELAVARIYERTLVEVGRHLN